MSWSIEQLEAWLREVEPGADKRGKFDWLEMPPIPSATAIQDAYHAIARTRHPDLFRNRVDQKLMDRLVRMYARVTAAYAELKDPDKCATYLRELRGGRGDRRTSVPPPAPSASAPAAAAAAAAAVGAGAAAGGGPSAPSDPSHSMNPRALSFYRRAEGVLRTGDRAAAMLHLKMAIAADPKSSFLRAALAELTRS